MRDERNDLIKIGDAIEAITDWLCEEELRHSIEPCRRINRFFATVMLENVPRAIPSADRPQGEWIRDRYWSRGVGMGEDYGFFYKCSMCEYEVESGYTRCGFNYCPYCGCRMKGADDEMR